MPLLTLENACLAYGHVALLDHAALQVDAGERIALIGRNGSGKSSLLKALAELANLDEGTLLVALDHSPQHMVALQDLQAQLDHADGWRLHTRIEQAISRLGLDGEARIASLSGGTIKRVALAQALAAEPDLLLLDEPTNHLDIDGILWLEQLIRDFRGGVLLVTHDRSFLDSVATRIVELDRGHLTSYPGSFGAYQERKAAELAAEEQQSAKFDKFLAQEEVWIRKGVEARRTRNEGRVLRLEALRRERMARRDRLGSVDLRVARGEQSGRLVAELEGVSKRYGDRLVVRNFTARILRGDKIGLIGANGAGKTTLLKLILGELEPDTGSVRRGTRLEVAYFDQFRTALDEQAELAEVISPGSDYVEIAGQRKHVISYLGDFLFAPERARSPVKSLSGGERNRLLLARLFARPANVLVLDEPTNDLDIETLELLEVLLQEYAGTLFLVSHDRRFLDNVVTQCVVAEGDCVWREYAGGYADWLAARARMPRAVAADAQKVPVGPTAATSASARREARNRLSYRESQELALLPDRIAVLEKELAEIAARLADAALYRDSPAEAKGMQARSVILDAELAQLLQRWEELELRSTNPDEK
ncbi:MAG: ATP-binding cassette domain-containing protein [Proteobacteria bacterium]|nr:ATP-binding cassette domain-containing protein [Pseudomonadota bacterium]